MSDDYEIDDDGPDPDLTLYCPNPDCRETRGVYVSHEWDTNAHEISDDQWICRYCDGPLQEEEPVFDEA